MSAAPGPSSARSLRNVMLGALAFYAVYVARQVCDIDGRAHFILFDAAMTSMPYAANLAHGHGLR